MIRNFCQAVLRRVFQFFQEFFYFPVFCPERSFFCRILPCRCGNIVRTRVRLRPKSQPCPLPCRSVRENAYLRRHPLSDLRFCLSPLPLYPLPEEMPGCSFCPCLWQGSAAPLSSRLPFLTKGGWCEAPEGIRKPDFDIANRKPNRQSLSLPLADSSLCTREPWVWWYAADLCTREP